MSEHPDNGFFRRMIGQHGVQTVPSVPSDEDSILLCMSRSEGLPAVPSDFGNCDGGCGEEIFWSKKAPAVKRRLCKRCASIAIVKAPPGEFKGFAITQQIEAEIAKVLHRPWRRRW